MPRQSAGSIAEIVSRFVDQLSVAIEQDAVDRARDAVLTAFGGRTPAAVTARLASPAVGGVRRGPGRPPGRARKKPPIQLCPVPGCQNRAAPVFGMVCSKHKDLPKAEIKKYREARRAQKQKQKVTRKGKGKGKAKAKRGRPAKAAA
jgi:hypothetical protein